MALRFVNPSNRLPTQTPMATTAAQTQFLARIPFSIGSGDVEEIVLSMQNFHLQPNNGTGVVPTSNSYNVLGIAIEYNSTFKPIFFSGSRTAVIAANSSDTQSDPLLASTFGLPSFTQGSQGFMRVQYSVDNGGTDVIPQASLAGGLTAFQRRFDPTKVSISNGVDGTGAMNYSMINGGVNGVDAVDNQQVNHPIMLGRFVSGNPPTIILVGDSKTQGVGDTTIATAVQGMARGLLPVVTTTANALGGINMGCSSGIPQDWGLGTPSLLTALLKYGTHSVEYYGTNSQNAAACIAIHTQLRAAHIQKIIRMSLTPRANNPPNISITSLTSVGTLATATVASTANITTGQSYPISGATPTNYNGTFAITVTDGTHFTYTITDAGNTPATGTLVMNDQYRTTAFQVAPSQWANGGTVDTFETAMKALVTTDLTYFDCLADRAEADGGSHWLWRVTGAANYSTSDGLHESATGYENVVGGTGSYIQQSGTTSTTLRTILAALTPQTVTYSVSGPSSGTVNVASTAFTLTFTAGNIFATDRITLTANNGNITVTCAGATITGNGTSTVLVEMAVDTASFTYTYTPTTTGAKTITYTNQQGWTDAAVQNYTSNAANGGVICAGSGAYE